MNASLARLMLIAGGIAVALALLASPAPAQLGDWTPAPITASSQIQNEHSSIINQTGNKISIWSAFNRRWSNLTTLSTSPIITKWNEHAIIQDGMTFWAFSSHVGQFTPLVTLSGTAVLVGAASAQTWIAAVQDGQTVYFYFPFTGNWQTATFPTVPTVTVRNFVAEIVENGNVYGVSAYYESVVPLQFTGAAAAGCFGACAMATTATGVHGFSAYQNRWSSSPISGPVTMTNGYVGNPGFVAVQDGSTIQLFSGAQGKFATLPVVPSAPLMMNRQVAVAFDAGVYYCYSGLLGTVSALPSPGSATVVHDQYFALIATNTDVYAFSAPKGTFAPQISVAGGTFKTGQSMALALSSGVPIAAYSALQNVWEPVPQLASPSPASYIGACAAVIVDPAASVAYGISARDTVGWSAQPMGAPDAVYNPTTAQGIAELIVLRKGSSLFAYNTRSEAWRNITMAGPLVGAATHMSTAIFCDSTTAYGFGVHTDRWSTEPLAVAPSTSNIKAQVDSGYVISGNALHAFTAVGQTASANEYPDLYRLAPIGGMLRLIITGEPFVDTYILAGEAQSQVPVAPFGTLLIDPASAFLLAAPYTNGGGFAHVAMQVPVIPALSGKSVYFQTFMNGSSGYYLTNCASVVLY